MSLIFEEPRDIPRIFTDDKKLSQILRNFISNALKFTPSGEVRVSATLVDGDRVTFCVADTGIGIAAEHVGALFQDFVQVDAPIQKRLRGTGLGLSLSRKLAAAPRRRRRGREHARTGLAGSRSPSRCSCR